MYGQLEFLPVTLKGDFVHASALPATISDRMIALQQIFSDLWLRSTNSVVTFLVPEFTVVLPIRPAIVMKTMTAPFGNGYAILQPEVRRQDLPWRIRAISAMDLWCMAIPAGEFFDLSSAKIVDGLTDGNVILPDPPTIYRWQYTSR